MFKKKGEKSKQRFFASRKIIAGTTLIGTTVGAGILGIPYVVAKAGFFYGLILIIVIGLAFLFLNLFAGEVVLRTKKQHQLAGYAEKYLGKKGKVLVTISTLLTIYGALIAYLIGEGATLYSVFSFGSPVLYTFIFFSVTFLIVYRGIKTTGNMEFFLILLLLLVVALIGILSFDKISILNFSVTNWQYLFLPYGVILFSFMALPAIPEMSEELGKEKKFMKGAIIAGSVIPIILYLIFCTVIVGVVGLNNFELLHSNERIATIALSVYSHQLLGLFANLLAIIAMFSSFLALSLALMEMYHFDYNISRKKALALTFLPPLVLALSGLATFISVLGFTGAIAGGFEAILMILMYWRAKKLGDRKPEYQMGRHYFLGSLLILIFAGGISYQFWSLWF